MTNFSPVNEYPALWDEIWNFYTYEVLTVDLDWMGLLSATKQAFQSNRKMLLPDTGKIQEIYIFQEYR